MTKPVVTKLTPITRDELDALSPAERRVLIANDVLFLLGQRQRDSKLTPTCGVYVDRDIRPYKDSPEMQLQQIVDAWIQEKDCQVCALGAALVATTLRFNDFTVGQFDGTITTVAGEDPRYIVLSDIREYLMQFFDREQLGLIETAYEGASIIKVPDEDDAAAYNFKMRYYDLRTRLRAIFKNIVANKGTFIP